MTIFAVEAGVERRPPCSERSTCPVAGSATMADTLGPSAAAESGPVRAERTPAAVGSAPRSVPVASTSPAPLRRPAATTGTRRAASRGGSIAATAMPAASVNTLIMASVSRAALRVRRTMTYHLPKGSGGPGGYGGAGSPPVPGVTGGRPPGG